MTESLGTLLKGSLHFCKTHARPILIASVVFGVLMFSVQKVLEVKITTSMENTFGDVEQMQEISNRIEKGDEEAFQEMMMMMGMMGEDGEMSEERVAKAALGLWKGMLPLFTLFFVAMILISLISTAFYLTLAIEGSQDFMTTLRRVPSLMLPLLGVWVWSFLRSFAWIPVIGILIAVIIGPRLTLSSVILVKEKKGVMESVKESYIRTRGYWGKIVSNGFVATLLVMIVMLILTLGVGLLGSMSMTAAAIVGSVIQSAMTAFGAIFVVRLSNTISDHPLQPAAPVTP
jgi:hypothetical protein